MDKRKTIGSMNILVYIWHDQVLSSCFFHGRHAFHFYQNYRGKNYILVITRRSGIFRFWENYHLNFLSHFEPKWLVMVSESHAQIVSSRQKSRIRKSWKRDIGGIRSLKTSIWEVCSWTQVIAGQYESQFANTWTKSSVFLKFENAILTKLSTFGINASLTQCWNGGNNQKLFSS